MRDKVEHVLQKYSGKISIWERLLSALIEQDLVDETTLMLDSTTVKVHQYASRAKKGDTSKKPDGAGEA